MKKFVVLESLRKFFGIKKKSTLFNTVSSAALCRRMLALNPCRGCMHRRVFIKKTWLSAFCFQLCTVTHFVCFLPLPRFSRSLVFFPYIWIRFGGFFGLCMEKKVGKLYLFVCKNYISLTCLNGFFAIFNIDNFK